jgi:hypothetical protein
VNFLYLFSSAIFFTFSSDLFGIKWKGLNIDLSQCLTIRTFNDDLNDQSDQVVKKIFDSFPLPSQKKKHKRYVSLLFNSDLDLLHIKTMLLVNLFIDRKALGFSQERYLNPLLDESIKRGFCSNNPPVEFIRPLKLAQSQLFENIRYSCLDYLKNQMVAKPYLLSLFFSSILDPMGSIQLSPEWDELISDSNNTAIFFDALAKFGPMRNLSLDGLKPEVLTSFFQRVLSFNPNFHIAISNSQISETLYELKDMTNRTLFFKNCHNFKVGKTDNEIQDIVNRNILYSLHGYGSGAFFFRDCSLDSESLEQCKNITHVKSLMIILPMIISLLCTYFLWLSLSSNDVLESRFSTIFFVFLSGFLAHQIEDLTYLGILGAMLIVYKIIPIFLKDNFVFAFQVLSCIGMIGFFVFSFVEHYRMTKRDMRRLMNNPFGIITKYDSLDKLFRRIF